MRNYLTIPEACKYLRCGKQWLYSKLQRGEIRGYKIAGKWQIEQGDLDKYVSKCCVVVPKARAGWF